MSGWLYGSGMTKTMSIEERVILMECGDGGATQAKLNKHMVATFGQAAADTVAMVAELVALGHLRLIGGRYYS